MKLLLTGATGFLGSHLLRARLAEGNAVVVLKRSTSSLARIADLVDRVTTHDVDRTDVRTVFRAHPEARGVVHVATTYGRDQRASEVVETNVLFPLRLLEELARAGGGTFVNTDTSFSKHSDRYGHGRGYTASKRQFRDWAKLAAEAGGVDFLHLRLEHPYGPDDGDAKFVTSMIRQCLANVPEIDLTPGEQRRDFVHVDDVVTAYLTLLRTVPPPRARFAEFEVGTGTTRSIRDCAQTIQRLTGATTRLNFGALPYRDEEFMHSQADTAALRALGWEPQLDLEAGLAATIHAERERLAGGRAPERVAGARSR